MHRFDVTRNYEMILQLECNCLCIAIARAAQFAVQRNYSADCSAFASGTTYETILRLEGNCLCITLACAS
jgi:hypothetical protein